MIANDSVEVPDSDELIGSSQSDSDSDPDSDPKQESGISHFKSVNF